MSTKLQNKYINSEGKGRNILSAIVNRIKDAEADNGKSWRDGGYDKTWDKGHSESWDRSPQTDWGRAGR